VINSSQNNNFCDKNHCLIIFRHCEIDPQSHFVETHNYASLLYLQGIAGQARNDGRKNAMPTTVNAMSENKNYTNLTPPNFSKHFTVFLCNISHNSFII